MAEINSKLQEQAEAFNGMRPDTVEAEGRARFLNDTAVFDGVVTSGDYVTLLTPLPKGSLVDPARSKVIVKSALSGVTVSVGVEGVDNNIVSSQAATSAGVFGGAAADLIEVADGNPKLKLEAGTPADGAEIRVSICYYVR